MIKSSLLKRIIILVFSTILISAALTAMIYTVVAKDTFIQIRQNELLPAAQSIASYISSAWTGDLTLESFPFLDSNYKFLDTQIHLYDVNGNVIKLTPATVPTTDDSTRKTQTTKKLNVSIITGTVTKSTFTVPFATQSTIGSKTLGEITSKSIENTPDQAQAKEAYNVLSGVIPMVLHNNTINTIKKSSSGNDYLVVAVPIVKNGAVVGAVAFAKPIKEFTAAINGLTITLLLSMLLSFAVMLFPAYYASRRIVIPIRQMRDVSLSIAKGDYSKRADESQKGEIGELAVALNKCSTESERLEQTRRDYVANVSHELRTPIASIRAIAETLKDGLVKNEEKKTSFYGSILNESLRLSALVDDLLELSRLQSGTTPFEKEDFSVYSLLKGSMELHESQIEQKGLTFNFKIPKNVPKAFSSSDRIEQVFVILLDNAIKHTNAGGVITLSTTWDNKKIYVSLSDTGEGISEDDLEHVFDRFYKVDKAHSSDGTGLGLSIALEVLTILGETIEASSELGVGSTFTFTLTRA